jgi:hypothetical protein
MAYCSATMLCPDEKLSIVCRDREDGNAYCQCTGESEIKDYRVAIPVETATCEGVATLCVSRESMTPLAPEECNVEGSGLSSTACNQKELCTTRFDIGNGLEASVMRYRGVSCVGDPARCSCMNEVEMETANLATACAEVLPFCDLPAIPISEKEPIDCNPKGEGRSLTSCSYSEECLRRTEVADGIWRLNTENRGTVCQSQPSGGSLCSCSTTATNDIIIEFEYDIEEQDLGIEVCEGLSPLCASNESPVFGDVITCEPLQLSTIVDGCGAQVECTLEGTLGAQPVRTRATTGVNCTRQGAEFACSCTSLFDSKVESVDVEVEAGTPLDVCVEAAEQCATLIGPLATKLGKK